MQWYLSGIPKRKSRKRKAIHSEVFVSSSECSGHSVTWYRKVFSVFHVAYQTPFYVAAALEAAKTPTITGVKVCSAAMVEEELGKTYRAQYMVRALCDLLYWSKLQL